MPGPGASVTSLLVAGGVYREICTWPEWKRTFGSAGRAASAVAQLVGKVSVLTPAPAEVAAEYAIEASLDGIGVERAGECPAIEFDYVHGMSVPVIRPAPTNLPHPVAFEADAPVVLRFGMLEATARVTADICIYDPQSAFAPESFWANGSRAGRLAIVANRAETCQMGGETDPLTAARKLLAQGAEAVVVKRGSAGALVVTAEGVEPVPARLTRSVWPVGSGDIFAAAFAVAWGVDGLAPAAAANFASFATADYVESMSLPLSPGLRDHLPSRKPVMATGSRVYLAGPFFSMGQLWLVNEARRCLRELGMDVFSPLHDIGRGGALEVAPADLAALDACDSVLALLDGLDSGTVFEVGYARAKGKPVYGLAQATPEEDLKMVTGSGCRVYQDFVTCLHHCAWAA